MIGVADCGRVAQLGEHLLCKQGVAGSNPVTSTNFTSLDSSTYAAICNDSLVEGFGSIWSNKVRNGESIADALRVFGYLPSAFPPESQQSPRELRSPSVCPDESTQRAVLSDALNRKDHSVHDDVHAHLNELSGHQAFR